LPANNKAAATSFADVVEFANRAGYRTPDSEIVNEFMPS
jgi:hypothetical protein